MKNKVIIIDDHALFNEGLSLILKESGQFNVIKQIYDSRQAYCYHCQLLVPEIAKDLGLSFYTVETHRKNINQKLKFKNRKEFYEFWR